MSNWSAVILTFSGNDELACPPHEGLAEEDTPLGTARIAAINAKLCKYRRTPFVLAPTSSSCQVIAVCDANNFAPEWTECYPEPADDPSLTSILRSLEWEYPESVELFWKAEDDDTFHRWCLQPQP